MLGDTFEYQKIHRRENLDYESALFYVKNLKKQIIEVDLTKQWCEALSSIFSLGLPFGTIFIFNANV